MKVRSLFLVALLSLGFLAGCANLMGSSSGPDDEMATGAFGRNQPANSDDQYMTDERPANGGDQGYNADSPSSSSQYHQEASNSSPPEEVPFEDARKLKTDMMKDPVANIGQY